jgi:hypothetical protein
MNKSPVRWLTDDQYRVAELRERMVAHADSQVGVRERGRNNGESVAKYLAECGLEPGHAWCAAFVRWCLTGALVGINRMGYGFPVGVRASRVREWAYRASNRLHAGMELVSTPDRGDLFYWLNKDGTGHIGIVISKPVLGVFRTIEGNTDSDGTREGDGVYKRTRTILGLKRRYKHGFIRIG